MFTSRLVAFSASILFLSSLTRASHGQELPNVKDCIRAQDEGMPLNNRLKTQAQACRAASKGLRAGCKSPQGVGRRRRAIDAIEGRRVKRCKRGNKGSRGRSEGR